MQRMQLRQAAGCTAAAQAGKLLGSDCSSSSIVRSPHPQRLLRTLASRAAKDPSRASAAETASAAAASAEAAAQAAAVSSSAASSWLHNMRNHAAQLQNSLAQAVSKGRNWKPAKISLPGAGSKVPSTLLVPPHQHIHATPVNASPAKVESATLLVLSIEWPTDDEHYELLNRQTMA